MKLIKDLNTLFKANSEYLAAFIKHGKFFLILQILFLILTIPINYISVYAPKMFVDYVFEQKILLSGLLWVCLMIFCTLVSFLSNQALVLYRNYLYSRAKIESKELIYNKLRKLYLSYFDNPERLNKLNRAFTYNESGGAVFVESIVSFITCIASLFTLTIISVSLEWWIWIVIVFLVFQQYISDRKLRKLNFDFAKEKNIRDREQNYFASIPTQAQHLSELLLNDGFDFFFRKYKDIYKKNLNLQNKHSISVGLKTFFNMLPNELFSLACYIIIGTKLINGTSTIGDYTLFFSLIASISSTLKTILYSFNTFYQQALEAQEYLDFIYDLECQRCSSDPLFDLKGIDSIEFKNVKYTYEGLNSPTIKNLNLQIKKGQRIAIVGNNGAGKTTFIKLLLALYPPQDGSIMVNGNDLHNYNADSYWKKSSVVLQNYKEFSLSIIENILLNDNCEQDLNKVYNVISKVGLTNKIASLKDGINSQVTHLFSADGVEFSGGERQRLAIARALVKDSEMYVFDEPSSALDPIAEDELLKCMNTIPKDKIVIYISHRLSNIHFCDRILYFRDGNIIADGTHQQLMEMCADYRKAYLTQSKKYQFFAQ